MECPPRLDDGPGLRRKLLRLEAYWELTKPQDHITIIALYARALSREKGYISLEFEFEGWVEYLDKQKEKQDTAF